jgi:hypothetical protein
MNILLLSLLKDVFCGRSVGYVPDSRDPAIGGGGGSSNVQNVNQVVHQSLPPKSLPPKIFFAIPMFLLPATLTHASNCIPIGEAARHVGETQCITGKVLRVKAGARGVHFIDFCEDQASCPFSVIVFGADLKDVGDVRRLAGRVIEIRGPVKLYNGRAEIILKRANQIAGGAMLIPPLPKEYDVEKQGHYSAGNIHPPKKLKAPKPTLSPDAAYGNEADVEDGPQ